VPGPDLQITEVHALEQIVPGQPFDLWYRVANRGTAPAVAPWADLVSVGSTNTGAQGLLLAVVTQALTIAQGDSLVVTQTLTLATDTELTAAVFTVVADGQRMLAQLDQTCHAGLSQPASRVPETLTLTAPAASLTELGPGVSVTLSRSGPRANPLPVDLHSSSPGALTVPASAVIGAGQGSVAVAASAVHDGVHAGNRAAVLSAAAPGYSAGSVSLTVLDDDLPALRLNPALHELVEGGRTTVTVSRDDFTATPLTVTLTAPSALAVLDTVVIPAGASSATFDLASLENLTFDPTNRYTLRASATGFSSADSIVQVTDDDLPGVTLSLNVTRVSESAGPNAVVGLVARDRISPQSLAVSLSCSDTNRLRIPALVVIPAGQTSTVFPVAPVDNREREGATVVTITGTVLSFSGSLPLAVTAPVPLEITDDDGPSLFLSLSRQTAPEGSTLRGIVRRNTGPAGRLEVMLASSHPARATVIDRVVIPEGSDSSSFDILALADGLATGDQMVRITAQATAYASAESVFTVTETQLPDLVVASLRTPTNGVTGQNLTVSLRIGNQGVASLTGPFTQRVSLITDPARGDGELVAQAPFSGSLAPGQEFEQGYQVRLPSVPGNYWLRAEVDVNGQVQELLEENNIRISDLPITVGPAYTATISAGMHQAVVDTPIPFEGSARYVTNGSPASFELVNIHVTVSGTRRVFSALTDATGRFHFTFAPLRGEAGSYGVGADHPGVATTPERDHFSLLGLRVDTPTVVSLVEGDTATGTLWIENPADVPLTGLLVTGSPPLAGVSLSMEPGPLALPAGGRAPLSFSIKAPTGSAGSGNFVIRITSSEGATVEKSLAFTIAALVPRLVVSPPTLSAGMRRGGQARVSFAVTNQGGFASGPLTLLLPAFPWMNSATGPSVPALAPGQGTVVSLLLTPPPDLVLGAYTGNLALVSTNSGASVPFSIRCLSDATGDLRVQSVDEYTYYAEGAPKVPHAAVGVHDPSGVIPDLATNTSAAGELLLKGLPEGTYELTVSADQHSAFHDIVSVAAGQTNEVTALMERQSVRYTWSVTPVEIEDRYTISVETTFETAVPKPVIVVEPSVIDLADMVENERQVNITISNHGLIAAQDARLTLPSHPDYDFRSIVTELGALPAQSTLTIPVVVQRRSNPVQLQDVATSTSAECSVPAKLEWRLPCVERVSCMAR
jgi:hypothetical protein